MPLITPSQSRQVISKVLPTYQRNSSADDVRRAIYEGEGHDEICDAMQSLAIFVAAIVFATSQQGKIVFDPLSLMEEYHSIEYKLVALPGPIQSHEEALKRCLHLNLGPKSFGKLPKSDVESAQLAKTWIQTALRISALFYLKLTKGGPPETLHGSVHMLRLYMNN